MQLTKETYKKIGLVYGILMVLILMALGVRWWQGRVNKTFKNSAAISVRPTAAPVKPKSYAGKFRLESAASAYKRGQEFDVSVIFEAPQKVLDGADVILSYNPNIINATGVAEGAYFRLTPRKDIDNIKGTVKITALDSASEEPAAGKQTLAVVHFRAIKSGATPIDFDFNRGSTNKTTLVEAKTSDNILGNVQGETIRIEP